MHHRVDVNIGLKQFTLYHNPQAAAASASSATILQPPPTVEVNAIPNVAPTPQPYVHRPSAPTATTAEVLYTQSEAINFKQMVEMKAHECGVLFMPIAKRFQDGKQVFQFGQYFVYIDNQVLFLQRFVGGNRVWTPIRLQEIIDMCTHI